MVLVQQDNDITYDKYVIPYEHNFNYVTITYDNIDKINSFAEKLAINYIHKNHRTTYGAEVNRIANNLFGELACEIFYKIPIVNWITGRAAIYNYPDITKHRIGILTADYGTFPVMRKNVFYHQIVVLRKDTNTAILCGLATKPVLKQYQTDKIIAYSPRFFDDLYTGFYGFHELQPLKDTDLESSINTAIAERIGVT